tara:strand:+ start:255 stop:923 length:669 start_codon:yes stop_codon:yes gene_type:complete
MRILVACEESQAITKEFRKLGHEAFSCDILPCSGGHPEWHYQQDVFEVINKGWDMMIAHPPCTYLAVSGARWMYNPDDSDLDFKDRRPHPKHPNRKQQQSDALDFVRKLMDAPIDKIAIENPISVISSQIRKPNQIVHPYHFGDKASKSTCLWLKNLPLLEPTNIVDKGEYFEFISKKGVKKRMAMWYYEALKNAKTSAERSTLRSKTFKGMAEAMANQWTK